MHDSVLYTQYVQYIQSIRLSDAYQYVRSAEAPRAQPFSAEAVLRMAEEGQSQRAGRWLETLLNRGVLDSEPLRWEVEVALGQVFFFLEVGRWMDENSGVIKLRNLKG